MVLQAILVHQWYSPQATVRRMVCRSNMLFGTGGGALNSMAQIVASQKCPATADKCDCSIALPKVQVRNNHILAKTCTITTITKALSTQLLGTWTLNPKP